MTYLVESLESAGYLERGPDPTDGRARLVRFTTRGWQQVEDALDIIAGMEAELASAMGPTKMRTLRHLLTTLATTTQLWRNKDTSP